VQLALRRSYGYAFSPPLNRYGMQGLGQTCGDGTAEGEALCFAPAVAVSTDPMPVDTSSGSLYSQLIAAGVNPVDAQAYLTTGQLPAGSTGPVTPGAVLTPAQLAAEQTSASAWLLQNVPATPAGLTQAQQLATLALTAAQIASGVTAGTVQSTPTSACPSGYKYSTGPCVPGASTGIIPGVSNTTLAIAAVAFLGLMMMGKRR
jgi:hypothetical protein